MAQNDRVIWTEGMFLRPHHYQQYTRYFETFIEERSSVLRPYPWGFAELRLDDKLLGLGKLAISAARGVFQDGTPFNMSDQDSPPLVLEIPETTKESVVYLCLPLRRPGAPDLDHNRDPESLARYAPCEFECQDNSTHGSRSRPAAIQVGRLRTRLMLQDSHRDDYACLGIARVIEVRADKSVLLDENYIPPVVDCQALPGLRGLLKQLHGSLNHRAEVLADRIGGGAAEIVDFLSLQSINRYLPLIAHLSTLKNYHPESLFQLLVSMAGELTTLTNPGKRAPEFPTYQHDKIHESFIPVFEVLHQSLSAVIVQAAIAIPVIKGEKFYEATLNDRSLLNQASFVLAVAADIPSRDLRERFSSLAKISSAEQIQQLVNMSLPGIHIRQLQVAPRQIPFYAGFVYFELEAGGELWSNLKTSARFAFHVGGDFPGLKIKFWAIRSST